MKKYIALAVATVVTASVAVPALALNNQTPMQQNAVQTTQGTQSVLTAQTTQTAQAIQTAQAQLRPDISIVIDGVDTDFQTASGAAVYPILYNGSTYLPLRAIGEVMGKNVNWDEENKIITLSGTRTDTTTNKQNPAAETQNIQIQVRPDFTIVIDGTVQQFKTASGSVIYPVLYNGSTYLPLRAIGEIMNSQVGWDSQNKVVTLTSSYTVTDADSFNNGQNGQSGQQTTTTGDVGAEKAKEVALQHAGLKASDVTFIKSVLDYDDGRKVYDVEFYSGNKEYDYEIDAQSGQIVSFDYDVENWTIPTTPATGTDIGSEKAKQIALQNAGLSESQVTFVRVQPDYDDGRKVYEVEFYSGYTEYDYEIDATNGAILEMDHDAEYYAPQQTQSPSSNAAITVDQAKSIALERAGVSASDAIFMKAKLDYDDGIQKYEIEFRVGRMEYECDVNAQTGTITDYSVDYDD